MRLPVKFLLPLLLAPGLLSAGSAHAATSQCFLTNLASCNQTFDGVTFSNFSFSGFTPSATDIFKLVTDNATSRSGTVFLDFEPNLVRPTSPAITNGAFTYTITLSPNASGARAFNNMQAVYDATQDPPGSAGSTSITSSGLPSPATSNNGSGAAVALNRSLTAQTFTQTFTFDPPNENDILLELRGRWTTIASTPGPLPLLGAATAFGLSRKIRSRIRFAA